MNKAINITIKTNITQNNIIHILLPVFSSPVFLYKEIAFVVTFPKEITFSYSEEDSSQFLHLPLEPPLSSSLSFPFVERFT